MNLSLFSLSLSTILKTSTPPYSSSTTITDNNMKECINANDTHTHHHSAAERRPSWWSRSHGIRRALFALAIMLVSCGRNGQQQRDYQYNQVVADTATHGATLDMLLQDYDRKHYQQRIVTANKIFGLLDRKEFTDSLIQVTPQMPPDTVDLLVWYWAGEYFFAQQEYEKGLGYAKKALPLAEQNHDLTLKSDCENLTGLFYFRMSNYAQALRHTHQSLEYDRRTGDKGRISSSLNTLAAICLVAKQLDEAEEYITEALQFSTAEDDSTRMAIQYGMASEIYHTMGKDHKALDYARKAYVIDSTRNNIPKVGIRLSQLAAAQISLQMYEAAELSVCRAIPILQQSGNMTSLGICQNQMGELLNLRGAHAAAVKHFTQAANIFTEKKDLYNESRAQRGLFEALRNTDPKAAANHLLRYTELKDSIYKTDMEMAISNYNAKYETEKLTQEKKRDDLFKHINFLVGIVLVSILLLIIAWLVYLGRIRRRHHLWLKKMNAIRSHFFTNITHEFRTPLTIIMGLSNDIGGDEDCKDDIRDKATTIERQGHRLLNLINQLLDIAKVKSSMGNANWRNGNITAYITMIAESFREYAKIRKINLTFIPKETVVMDFVPDYITKLISNLLANAIKFTPEYGRVSITMWRRGNTLLLDIIDTGKGMDKESQDHVFELYYQAEGDTQNIGTGIGLTLVKQIIEALNGTITVESTPGQGTTFHISLPIHNHVKQDVGEERPVVALPAEEKAEEEPHTTDSNSNESNESNDDCRILVVEDNHDVAHYIGAQLKDSYSIYYAANGQEGLQKALETVPNLIITDLMMPEMNGLDLCRHIRGNDIINHVPIIIISAKASEEERIKGLEAGADAYMTKPFNTYELRTRVAKLLESRKLMQKKFAAAIENTKELKANDDTTAPNEADLVFLTKVADAIHTLLNRSKDTSVTAIASIMCMSSSQFYRKMMAITGQTPAAYIQHIRIKKAKKLLDKNPDMKLLEVAALCGFDVYPNFVRTFKNVCGITPSEYRKRQDRKA